MKKFVALLLVAMLSLCSVGFAEGVDLSAMSLDELIDLRQQIDLLIFGSDEFKEVAVPAGDYIVGEDIPAGMYSLDCDGFAMIEVYSAETKDFSKMEAMHTVGEGMTVGKIELKDGWLVSITSSSIIFKTFAGLGF